ncbi:DUF317 domain-containing protein [Embleya sp. NBC_00896]|uniref:DUF317 domain-containing protein n=1 Tax=Embleya sp. NBC_00896 TaxID=2975961 RepID=UPI002F918A37|nr:DUF317 domain-containing protein [Embleya sp. NBC_00896]
MTIPPNPPPAATVEDRSAQTLITPARMASAGTSSAGVLRRATAPAGWHWAHDAHGNVHVRSTTGRVWVGYLPQTLPTVLHPHTPTDLSPRGVHPIRGVWMIDGYPYGKRAWTVWFNDTTLEPRGAHVPPEFVAAAVTELAAPGHEEPDWLADPGHPDTVWALTDAAGWTLDHADNDDITARAPDRTAELYHYSGDVEEPDDRGTWLLRAGILAYPGHPGLWAAGFSAATPAAVIAAVMSVLTGPGARRHPEDPRPTPEQGESR